MATKEFKGTKFPWKKVEHNWSDTSIYGDDGNEMVCTNSIYDDATEDTQEEFEAIMSANFQLIEAAPQLLEALQEILFLHSCEQEGITSGQPTMKEWMSAINKAESAISSALGE